MAQDNPQQTTWRDMFTGWYNEEHGYNTQIEKLLKAGLEFLKLDIAIVSRIEDSTYTVEHFVGGGLQKGQQFELGSTYCSITTQQNAVVAIYHMGISQHYRHPCYEAFHLETYIGTPIVLDGKIYGTINFSSATPRATAFTDEQKMFVQLMGEAVNWSLMAREKETKQATSE